MLETIRSWTLS